MESHFAHISTPADRSPTWFRNDTSSLPAQFWRASATTAPQSPRNIIDLKLVQQGLHDVGEPKMSASLQEELDAVDQAQYDAILLGYGLCNNGIRNLRASIPIVVPRAHDCITLLAWIQRKIPHLLQRAPGRLLPLHRLARAFSEQHVQPGQHDPPHGHGVL